MIVAMIDRLSPSWRKATAVVSAAFLGASLIVTAADRRPPVTVVDGEPLTEEVRPGQPFDGAWTVTVNRKCSVRTRRWLQSLSDPGWETPLPEIDPGFQELQYMTPRTIKYPVTTFTIPAKAPDGEMTYNIEMVFVCWHWGDELFPIKVTYPPMTFRVTSGTS